MSKHPTEVINGTRLSLEQAQGYHRLYERARATRAIAKRWDASLRKNRALWASHGAIIIAAREATVASSRALSVFCSEHNCLPKGRGGFASRAGQRQYKERLAIQQECEAEARGRRYR